METARLESMVNINIKFHYLESQMVICTHTHNTPKHKDKHISSHTQSHTNVRFTTASFISQHLVCVLGE